MELQFDEFVAIEEPENCKGLYFRGYTNKYWDGSKLSFKSELRFLKRKSCSGCSKCGWFHDTMSEQLYADGVYAPKIKHGSLYSVKCEVLSTDWETGYADDWMYKFYEVEE